MIIDKFAERVKQSAAIQEQKPYWEEFNDTDRAYTMEKTIHQLFEEQVAKTPAKIAVVFGDEEITYKQLNEKANGLAAELRELGVGPEVIVGIMIENSIAMIVGALGILKAGGAYLPIDPETPRERLRYLLEDSEAKVVLSNKTMMKRLNFTQNFRDLRVIDLTDDALESSGVNLPPLATPSHLAYIMYTSGSTGVPKGVLTEHRSVVNYIYAYVETVNLTSQDGYLQHSNFTFDTLAQEVHPILSIGGKVVIITKEQLLDPSSFSEIVNKHQVTALSLTPQEINHLNNYEQNFTIRVYTCGGEALRDTSINNLVPNSLIYNAYGPTECTVYTSFYQYKLEDKQPNIPIGKPIGNTKIYILDQQDQVVPIGVTGQLCIAGAGVARGYLKQPELTAKKFVDNPFGAGKMYYSGDLARWLPDGNIEFLGRMDQQVKIRGARIELGEIESQLLQLDRVKDVVVLVLERHQGDEAEAITTGEKGFEEDAGEKYLCAYFVAEVEIPASEWRRQLAAVLPYHLIPSHFIQLERMPLTASGKVDRQALAALSSPVAASYVAPRQQTEVILAQIWSAVLGHERVGINDNFFELGGHSLKGTILITKIHQELQVEVPLKELFSLQTIGNLSEYIRSASKSAYGAIAPVAPQPYYETSSAQRRMWFFWQLDQQSTAYNLPEVLILEGDLDQQALEAAFLGLIKRHESFRTTFAMIDDAIVQRVSDRTTFKLEYTEKTEAEIEAAISDFVRPFDLSEDQLLRVKLIKTHPDRHYLMLDMHHIIADGISMVVLFQELMMLYHGDELEAPKLQYKDFAQWQNTYLKSEKIRKQEAYWLEQFAGELPRLNLPLDYQREPVPSFDGGKVNFKLTRASTKKLNRLARETGTTMYMVLLSAVNILLFKYTGQDDIIVGSPIAGRPHADLGNIIGMFVNTLALRNFPQSNKTYREFLKEIKATALMAYENQDYQFEELVEKLNLQRDLSHNPLFDVVFVLQNMELNLPLVEGLRLTEYDIRQTAVKFDLTLSAIEAKDEVLFSIEYRSSLFKGETIERMALHLLNLIESILTDPEQLLGHINILTEAERKQILDEFNDTATEYPQAKTIPQLFSEQVAKTPEKTALVFGEGSMTYGELDKEANRVANLLRQKGVKPKMIVGMMVERSFEMIIGILGILKAGGTYLPIDPDYPKQRIKFMLEDSEATLLLTQSWLRDRVEFDGEKIDLDCEKLHLNAGSIENCDQLSSFSDLAYVIYTSGTTGMPKGTLIEHQGVIRLVKNPNYIKLDHESIILQTGSIAFDATTFEIWGALLNGGQLLLANIDVITNPTKLKEIITKGNVNTMWCTSTLYNQLIQADVRVFDGLQNLLIGGEKLSEKHVNLLREHNDSIRLINGYGPTENTTFTTTFTITDPQTPIPIGKPINNTQVYILNEQQLCGIGIPGELCIGGDGLARGYLNRPELTAAKFVANPLIPNERLYRTGDLARWLPDGNVEFLGRMDHQVKIRGFRIELEEIESQLLKLDGVKEAVVLVKEEETKARYLCAYLVTAAELVVIELRKQLSLTLPDYMIPSYFVQLEQLPLTSSGKVDRQAMPEPDGARAEYVAPRNPTEEILAGIWSVVLGKEQLSIHDNFFELGGHSLKATTLISRIHKELNVELPLKEVFRTPTIAGISESLANAEKNPYAAIEAVAVQEYYETSAAQKRMWFLQQLDHQSTAYNMPEVLIFDGNLDKCRLEKAFSSLMARHEILRTTFETVAGKPLPEPSFLPEEQFHLMQRVTASMEFRLEYVGSSEKNIEELINDFIRPFDLGKAPLLRAKLIKTDVENRHYLLFDMHHIIADGISMALFVRELIMLYRGEELPAPRIQYKDFAHWQNTYLKSEKISEQKNYWLEQFAGELPILNLPTDYERGAAPSFAGDYVKFNLDSELTKKIKCLARETGTTMYMVLLSVVNILLAKYTGQDDIIIGSPIAGRPHADLENIMGMFVNTLALRNYPQSHKTYAEFLSEVKATALKAYENQDYQFEELVESLNLQRDLSRNPLFDLMFVLQNMETKAPTIEGLKISEYDSSYALAKFDLTLTAVEVKDELRLTIGYRTSLFKRETVKNLARHWQNIIKSITTNQEILLGAIKMLSPDEAHKILYEFNNTAAPYPWDKTLHQLFAEQVAKTPDKTALVFAEKSLTYGELNEQSQQLARVLREEGVKPNDIVGLMVQRSCEMIVGVLGILKAGGAYLPIDPEYPEERIHFMFADSGMDILLTQSWLSEEVTFTGKKINLDTETQKREVRSGIEEQEHLGGSPSDLAYVIYTTGSTGKPKGVMIEHSHIVNFAMGQSQKTYQIGEGDRILQSTSISFDPSAGQMFMALLSGATLYLINKETVLDATKFQEFLRDHRITYLGNVPSLLKGIDFHELKELRVLVSGGEICPPAFARKWCDQLAFYNVYGPTETTVQSLVHLVNSEAIGANIPIGKPLGNYQAYILSADGQPLPIGVVGELYIGGASVARGYLNRPELTAEKFLPNPFIKGERMYRTGDLARWLPDGNVEFLGRIDHQVKIRGFRIELGEIENQLLKHPFVKEAVVVTSDQLKATGDQYLCAYFVSEIAITASELRQHLSATLPDYMIPSYFVKLERMPLTPSGKVDRQSLPEPDAGIGARYVKPRNFTEEILAGIWSVVLGKERVGIDDNFFELGGHSLKATALISRIHKELNVELPLKQLFKTPTISGVSEYLAKAHENVYAAIETIAEQEYYETSAAQKRMWFLQQVDQASIAYNIPEVFILEGNLDRCRLERAFASLIQRHESLRTTFATLDDAMHPQGGEQKIHLIQKVAASVELKMDYEESGEDFLEERIKTFIRPFDLGQAPLLRTKLIKTYPTRHYLLLDMHHIIADGISIAILTRELMMLYGGQELAAGRIQYKDFSQWQNNYLKSEKISKQKNYWLEQLRGDIPILNLPLDYQRPSLPSFAGDHVNFKLDQATTATLNHLARGTGTTMYMVLLSVINILLLKYTGQSDIIIGSPIAGRPHFDLETIIGMFVNTLVFRNFPENNKTYAEFLSEVKETALMAYENQDYQFEELVNNLQLQRDLSRNPLFDVMFVLQNMGGEQLATADLEVTKYETDQPLAKFDLTFIAVETVDEILFHINYATSLFKRETIERLSRHLQNVIEAIIADKEVRLENINWLSPTEQEQLLLKFNHTATDFPSNQTVTQLFESQVEKTPNHLAVVYEGEKLTYWELNERANGVAYRLRTLGVKPDDYVALMTSRSLEMIIGILGILKAGGAYVPLDPTYPEARLNYILEDCQPKALLTDEKQVKTEIPLIMLKELREESLDNLECVNKPDDLIYLIYTSGTTGRPKGVMVEHRHVVNLVHWKKQHQGAVVLQNFNYSFDGSVWEIFPTLLSGGTLEMIPEASRHDPKQLLAMIPGKEITLTPSLFQALLDYAREHHLTHQLHGFTKLFFAGESLPSHVISSYKKLPGNNIKQMFNAYGPTEATVGATCYALDQDHDRILIGKPINNGAVYILNGNQLCGIGIAGELCIGGAGVARGYWQQPQLTAAKFVANPFLAGKRLYRTGDLARWLPDGNIEFLGRIDQQVKIRGFRIELEEIEATLLKYPHISEAVVLDREDKLAKQYLCAYFVAGKKVDLPELKAYLTNELPNYMIPAKLIPLASIPLTANQKIDRQKLAMIESSQADDKKALIKPKTKDEKIVAAIWKDILAIDEVGLDDNFFDLGGNSLDMIKLSTKLTATFKREISVILLFRYTTISGIVSYLNQEGAGDVLQDRSATIKSRSERLKSKSQKRRR